MGAKVDVEVDEARTDELVDWDMFRTQTRTRNLEERCFTTSEPQRSGAGRNSVHKLIRTVEEDVSNVSDIRDATELEIETCRHVVDTLSTPVWISLAVAAAERFAFYTIITPWQNYMQNSINDRARPGALGLGQSRATAIYNAFYLVSAITPTPFAVLSDTKLGRFRTLTIALSFYVIGSLTLLLTSIPSAIDHGAAGAGLVIAMVLIALGVGGVRTTMSVLIGDQYGNTVPQAKRISNGEVVVVDRTMTIQYIYNVFYWLTNVAGLAMIPATLLERHYGFWTAYLLGAVVLWAAFGLLILYRNSFVKIPTTGNVLTKVVKILRCAMRNGFNISAASPQYQIQKFNKRVPWTQSLVTQTISGLIACRVLTANCVLTLCYNQMSNNLVSQAGQMELTGMPNDMLQVFNPIACIILGPVIQSGLYPALNRWKIAFRPVARITAALLFMSGSMAYSAGIQKLIYSRGPCYDRPLGCAASNDGVIPNSISVWTQLPVYFIVAVGEIFGNVTVMEYSYSKAPRGMKAMIAAFSWLMVGIGSALGMAISPAAKDPQLVVFYAVVAAVMAGAAIVFWLLFRHFDTIDDDLDAQQASADRHEDEEEEI